MVRGHTSQKYIRRNNSVKAIQGIDNTVWNPDKNYRGPRQTIRSRTISRTYAANGSYTLEDHGVPRSQWTSGEIIQANKSGNPMPRDEGMDNCIAHHNDGDMSRLEGRLKSNLRRISIWRANKTT